jgi:hypothetical protein
MKYKIKYNYDTGDSFGSSTCEDFLELTFENYDNAVSNLNRIREHYEQYKELNHRSGRYKEEIVLGNSQKDWFVSEYITVSYHPDNPERYNCIDKKDIDYCLNKGFLTREVLKIDIAENNIILYADNGNQFKFWAPWCGYFEHLNSVEIVIETLKYEF